MNVQIASNSTTLHECTGIFNICKKLIEEKLIKNEKLMFYKITTVKQRLTVLKLLMK